MNRVKTCIRAVHPKQPAGSAARQDHLLDCFMLPPFGRPGWAAVILLLPILVAPFSILDIEGGGPASSLGVGGGSELYIVGTDLGDPFNQPVVLIGNNPNPFPTPCKVEGFTSTSVRFHCTIQPEGLPVLHQADYGTNYFADLTLHVLVNGREAMCDVGARVGGTGLGDCTVRFDVGGTPRIVQLPTRALQGGEMLRLQATDRAALGGANYSDGVVVRLRRGSFFLGCVPRDDDGELMFEGLATGELGCRLENDKVAASGFWRIELNVQQGNYGHALVAPASRRVDIASNELYDVETVPRISAVTPSSVSAAGGATLTIKGDGFGGRMDQLEVSAAGVACALTTLRDGTLTCTLSAIDTASSHAPYAGDRGVRYEWWRSTMAGVGLVGLRALPTFPSAPSGSSLVGDFELPGSCWEGADSAAPCAGSRLSGWFVPPASLRYSFSLRADGEAELLWSANETAKASARIVSSSAGGGMIA
eukprot:1495581-Prymnesium_polylepis.1